MSEIQARDMIARQLSCEPATVTLVRGPFAGYRGSEAHYSVGGQPAGHVIVRPPNDSRLGREPGRSVIVETRGDIRRFAIRTEDEVAW